jgi:hypothetical protein
MLDGSPHFKTASEGTTQLMPPLLADAAKARIFREYNILKSKKAPLSYYGHTEKLSRKIIHNEAFTNSKKESARNDAPFEAYISLVNALPAMPEL